WDQLVPFQRSVSIFKPSSSWSGAVKWPTAQASLELRTATAFSTFLVAEGSTVGTTVHPGAALAAVPHASRTASITDVSTSRHRRFRSLPATAAPLLDHPQHPRSAPPPAWSPGRTPGPLHLGRVAASPGRRMVVPGGTGRPRGWPNIGRSASIGGGGGPVVSG